MNRILRVSILSILSVCLIAIQLLAHSGRTDRYGGHFNRKTGAYHYHNPGYAHAANNPYQDHTKCGICSTSKKEITTDQKKETQKEQTYVGSAKSNKFHHPNCTWALKIKSENLITFKSRQDAQDKGYVPCKVCQP